MVFWSTLQGTGFGCLTHVSGIIVYWRAWTVMFHSYYSIYDIIL